MTTPPPDTKVQSETLDDVADRIAYKYLDRTVGSAKLKSDILSALRNERERANDVLKPVRKCLARLRKNARTDGQFYSIHLGLMDIRELDALIDSLQEGR